MGTISKDRNLDIYFGDELHEAGIVNEYKNVYDVKNIIYYIGV
jgi:hypothetical protein